ncbi:hypothetical protein [Rhizobium mongolense]|uniref:F-box domain-containing protein n=2 Tax=Rhizobium mongolense TaxID=57676 RepID=A0ABR6IYM4_9HYPH|nr:hypothetical protein [Rhizobium mongolense]MBB4233002.1 hypothetical protein [Rhizobium mongolense]TVZ74744.1 hypothetical protein BCL32_0042 [Rhizobium mongolense USDA 1844]
MVDLPSELNDLPRDLNHLPRDVFSRIAKEICPYDNPQQAAVNLANLRATNHEILDKFPDSAIGSFEARLSRIGALQSSLASKTLPDFTAGDVKFVTLQAPAIQPILKFYELSAQTSIVDNALLCDERWQRTLAATVLSTNLNDLHDPSDRTRLINQALSSFGDDDPTIRTNGGIALVRADGHLDAVQQARLTELFHRNPELEQQYNHLKADQQAWYQQQRVQLPSADLDRSINIIAGEVGRLPAGLSSSEERNTAHIVAKSIAECYNCAHNELMNFDRSRERSTLGR